MSRNGQVIQNWSSPNTTAENEILPGYLKWAWTSRGVSLAVNVLLIMQLTYYCTDMLGMPATLVGTLLLASKLFDGITDLIVGFIIDKTNTKWGKARPYEICILFVWLFTILVFSTPEFGLIGKSIFVFLMYTLINSICATFLNGGDAVYLARSIRSEKNRVSVMSFNGGIIMLFSIVIGIVMPQLIQIMGTTKTGWTMIALLIGIPMAIIGIFRFVFVKEVAGNTIADKKDKNSIKLKDAVKCIGKNKYIWILAGMTFVVQLSNNIGATVNTYYFKYIMGDIGLASLISASAIVTPIVMMFFPKLIQKFGSIGALKLGAIAGMSGFLIRIIGDTNLITLMIGTIVSSMGVLPISMMISIYLIDCMDYGEWKTGTRIEGMIGSINSFSSKLGNGIASASVGLIMGLSGYDGTLAVQSGTANLSIEVLFNYVPMVLMIFMFILAMRYRSLGKILPKIKEDLEKKKIKRS